MHIFFISFYLLPFIKLQVFRLFLLSVLFFFVPNYYGKQTFFTRWNVAWIYCWRNSDVKIPISILHERYVLFVCETQQKRKRCQIWTMQNICSFVKDIVHMLYCAISVRAIFISTLTRIDWKRNHENRANWLETKKKHTQVSNFNTYRIHVKELWIKIERFVTQER